MAKKQPDGHPAIGIILPNIYGDVMGEEPFGQFRVHGLHGLARVRGDELDFLAIIANEPGRGAFSGLLRKCKRHYRQIRIFSILNDRFGEFLLREGFAPSRCLIGGDPEHCLVWKKEDQCTPPSP